MQDACNNTKSLRKNKKTHIWLSEKSPYSSTSMQRYVREIVYRHSACVNETKKQRCMPKRRRSTLNMTVVLIQIHTSEGFCVGGLYAFHRDKSNACTNVTIKIVWELAGQCRCTHMHACAYVHVCRSMWIHSSRQHWAVWWLNIRLWMCNKHRASCSTKHPLASYSTLSTRWDCGYLRCKSWNQHPHCITSR